MITTEKQLQLRNYLCQIDYSRHSNPNLVDYLKTFGVTTYDTDKGERKITKRTKKAVLLSELNTVLHGHSGIDLVAQAEEAKKYDIDCGTDNSEVIVKAIEKYDKLYSDLFDQPEVLAVELEQVAIILNKYVVQQHGLSTNATRASKRTRLLGMLKRAMVEPLKGQPEFKRVETHFKIISKWLSRKGGEDTIIKNEQYKVKLDERSKATEIIDVQLDPFIDKARQALIDLKSWKDVAIALALVTGRRMFSEILMDTTEFSLIDGQDMAVMFGGQAKTRDRGELEVYQIPTLVEAELVVKGHQYLASLGKLGDTSETDDVVLVRDKTKNRHSRYINQHMKSDWVMFPGVKPKALRELYALKAYQNYQANGGRQKLNVYICDILGHGDRSVADAYQSDYNLI